MGGVARRILFNLRNAIFTKLQELPVAFFNQNRAGDLISRINNDTDKLNQFFAQALMQFLGNAFLIVGAGILLLVLNFRPGGASLLPAVLVMAVTQLIGGWVKRANFKSLQTLGGLSGPLVFTEGKNPFVKYCLYGAQSNADNSGWEKAITNLSCTDRRSPSDPNQKAP